MFELFHWGKKQERPLTESEKMSQRVHTEFEAIKLAEDKHPHRDATEEEVQSELREMAEEEDEFRHKKDQRAA